MVKELFQRGGQHLCNWVTNLTINKHVQHFVVTFNGHDHMTCMCMIDHAIRVDLATHSQAGSALTLSEGRYTEILC